MKQRSQDDTKQMYAEAIRQNIARKGWQKLSEVMIGAEQVGVAKNLRRKGWFCVGEYEAEKGNHPSAIIALNSARMIDPHPDKVLDKMYAEVESFCRDFDGRFSRQDLFILGQALERIGAYHSVHSRVADDVRERGKKVTHWIKSRLSEAPLKEETPATHHVQRIYSALYAPMKIEEVRAEFARIVEPLIRERLERKMKTASGGGGKGPRVPDEEKSEPPGNEPKEERKPKKNKRKGNK